MFAASRPDALGPWRTPQRSQMLELFETAKKAADAVKVIGSRSSAETSRCIEALDEIKRVPRSRAFELMRTTNIGNRLQSLAKHPNPEIRSAAAALLHLWLRMLYHSGRATTDSNHEARSASAGRRSSSDRMCGREFSSPARKGCLNNFAVFQEVKLNKNSSNRPLAPDLAERPEPSSRMVMKGTQVSCLARKACLNDFTRSLEVRPKENPRNRISVPYLAAPPKSLGDDSKPAVGRRSSSDRAKMKGNEVSCLAREARVNDFCGSRELKRKWQPSNRSWAPDLAARPEPPGHDSPRRRIQKILTEQLSKVASEVEGKAKGSVLACDPSRVALAVESAMFRELGAFNGAKKLKYRSILFNMRDPNNPDLRRKVLLREIKPEQLVVMSCEELASEKRQQEYNLIRQRAKSKEEAR